MLERKFKSVSALLMGILLILIALIAYGLVQLNRALPPTPLPKPNGYDDFVKAGQTLVGDPGNYDTMTQEELVNDLDAQNCRVVIQSLQETRRNREPLMDVLLHEREWMRRNSTLRERLQSLIPIPAFNPTKRMKQGFLSTVQSREYKLDQL